MNIKLDHIKNALICSSIYLEVDDEENINKLESFFNNLLRLYKIFFTINYKFPFDLQLSNNGKNMLISLVCNEDELIKILSDFGKNIIEDIKFNLVLKSDININEIIYNNIDIIKLFTLIFSIKTETSNVKALFENILKILKDVKIGNIEIFDKISKYLDLLNFSLASKLKIEYDAKVLAEQYAKKSKQLCISIFKQIEEYLKYFYMCFGFDILESVNLDDINIILGDLRYLNYYVISIKIPGLSKFNELCSSKYRTYKEFSEPICVNQ